MISTLAAAAAILLPAKGDPATALTEPLANWNISTVPQATSATARNLLSCVNFSELVTPPLALQPAKWGVEVTAGSLALFRRIGAIYLGLALMFFLGRAAAPSDLRSAVCLVTGGAITLLACLGLFEFLTRRASAGIFRSVVGEVVLAAGFVWVWWGGR